MAFSPLILFNKYMHLPVPLLTRQGTLSHIISVNHYFNAGIPLNFYVSGAHVSSTANVIRRHHRSGPFKNYLSSHIGELNANPQRLTPEQASFIRYMASSSNRTTLQRVFTGKGSPQQIADAMTAAGIVYEVMTNLSWQTTDTVGFPAAATYQANADTVSIEDRHATDPARIHYMDGRRTHAEPDIPYRQVTEHTTFVRTGMAVTEAVTHMAGEYLGLDCNGFAGNLLNLAHLATRDAVELSIPGLLGAGNHGARRRTNSDIRPNDLIIWANAAHIAVVNAKTGDALEVCESMGAGGHSGPHHSTYTIRRNTDGHLSVDCDHGRNVSVIIVPPDTPW